MKRKEKEKEKEKELFKCSILIKNGLEICLLDYLIYYVEYYI
jgi:hypothetical protein